jgi:hypothetical protein
VVVVVVAATAATDATDVRSNLSSKRPAWPTTARDVYGECHAGSTDELVTRLFA